MLQNKENNSIKVADTSYSIIEIDFVLMYLSKIEISKYIVKYRGMLFLRIYN